MKTLSYCIVSALAGIAACAAPDPHRRHEELVLEMLRSRLRTVDENNLNFNETMLAERNRYFEWIKGPQERLRSGATPREEDINRMIATYASWANLARENGKWMSGQLDGLNRESDEASHTEWITPGNAERAKELTAQARQMIQDLRDIIRLRTELANESQAEAEKLHSYKRTLFK